MDRTWLRAAIAKLTCGVATIVVGGSTDLEIREKNLHKMNPIPVCKFNE